MPGIGLHNLVKVFPSRIAAVDGLTFDVSEGELLVLVGPSGCGKTTTLRLLAGLEQPTRGTITIGGRTANKLKPRERNLAMVFQRPALLPHLTARENMAFGLRWRRVPGREIANRVEAASKSLGLVDMLDRRPGQLSGGQQQRVALGRAMVRQPAAFLLDEPLSHLDPMLRGQLRREIRSLQARLGITMLYVTHDPREATMLAERLAVMYRGRLQQIGEPQEIYRRPANRFVAQQSSVLPINLVDGWLRQQQHDLVLRCERLVLTLPERCRAALAGVVDHRVTLGVRPEHLEFMPNIDSDTQEWLHVRASVETVRRVADNEHLDVIADGVSLTAVIESAQKPTPGNQIYLAARAENLHFFCAETGQAIEQRG